MPEDNTPTITGDPKEYIASLGTDMVAKSQAEMNRSQNDLNTGNTFRQEGNKQVVLANGLNTLTEEVMNDTPVIGASAEEVLESGGKDLVTLIDKILNLRGDIEKAKTNFQSSLPDKIQKLISENPEGSKLQERIKKLFSDIERLNEVEEYLQASQKILDELPEDVADSLEAINEEAKDIRIQGEQNLVKAGQRDAKDREIIQNAQENIAGMQGTIGREQGQIRTQNVKGVINSDGIKATQEFYSNLPANKAGERVRSDLQKQGKSEEEIAQAIENAKARINQAIAEEQAKNNQTNVSTPPSSYTTPVS